MADKITIGVDADTSAFEKKVSDLEKKISNMRQFGAGGAASQLANQYRTGGQEDRAKRLEEFRERQSAQARRELSRDLKKQEGQLDNLLKKHQAINSIIDKQLVGGQSKMKLLEREAQLLDEINKKTKDINQAKSTLNFQGPGVDRGAGFGPFSGRDLEFIRRGMGGGRGIVGGIGAFGRIARANPMIPIQAMAGVMAGVGSAARYGGDLAFQVGTQQERETQAQAGVAGGLSELARLQERRRGYELEYFGPERMRAMERARTRRTFSEARDITGTAGDTMVGAGAGMGLGAVIGGTLGAGAGVLTTLATGGLGAASIPAFATKGAMLGAGAGAIFGGARSLGDSMMDDTRRSMIFDRDFYDKIKTQEQFTTYQEQLEQEKAKNFEKTMAQEYFESNRERFLGIQRAFGMGDEELFQGTGSLLQRGADAGFMTDTIINQMSAISGAGGTTAASQEGAITASQMARGLNLTSAGELLGRVSGATGMGGAGSKDEVIRMYAEATRIGLDGSEFAKETRTFLDVASGMAYQSGVDFSTVANMLGQGVDTFSQRGIQASQNALQQLQQETGTMGGLTGQYQLAELGSEEMTKALGGKELSMEERAMLSGMDITRVSLEDDYIKTLLNRRGIEDEEQQKKVVEQIRQGKIRSGLRTESQIEAFEDYQSLLDNPLANPDALRDAESRVRELGVFTKGEVESRRGVLEQKASARMKAGLLTGRGGRGQATSIGDITSVLDEVGGRAADKAERAKAQDDLAQLGRLTENLPKLNDAFDTTTTKTLKLAEIFGQLAENMNKNKDVFGIFSQKMKEALQAEANKNTESFVNDVMSDLPFFGNSN